MRRAVVALLLPVLAACGATTSGTAAGPASTTAAPAPDDGLPDGAFRVAAPVLLAPAGPGPARRQPPCTAALVTTRAATRAVVGGVDGVVRIEGRGCSIQLSQGPHALLDVDHKRLPVALDTDGTKVNGGGDPRWDIPFGDGLGLWGFSWRGSWCGPRPAFVSVAMPGGDFAVPLTGAVPACDGTSDSVLRPGAPGGLGAGDELYQTADAVEPPPPTWAGLRASLATTPTGLAFTLTNPTTAAIALSPCPDYGLMASYFRHDGSGSDTGGSSPLPCDQQPQTIPAQGEATYSVPSPDLPDPAEPGTTYTVQIAIAGVPTATLKRDP